MEAEEFSFTQPTTPPIDFEKAYAAEIACPTSGLPCKAREAIVSVCLEDGLPHGSYRDIDPMKDGMKMRFLIKEISARAVLASCEGMVEGVCPVRERMNNSEVRKTSVNGFRAIRKRITRKEK